MSGRRFFAVVAVLLGSAASALAQPAPPVPPVQQVPTAPAGPADGSVASDEGPAISLDELIQAAIENSPAMAAARYRVEAARQRIGQERALPDPMLSAGWNSSGNPLPGAGLGTEPTANIGVMVTQPIPYAGKRDLRAAVAEREVAAEAVQVDAARVDLTARVKDAFYRLAYLASAEGVLARNAQLLETLLRVAESRYSVGRAAQQDVIKAQSEITLVELRRERLHQERQVRNAQLNALLNRAPGTPIGRLQPLQPRPFDVSLESVLASAAVHAPMLRREQAMVARNESAVAVAQRDFKPDFAVSAGYYYMGSMPAMYMARFDIELPLQKARRQLALAERVSTVSESRAGLSAAKREVEARVQEEYQMAATASRLARLYGETLLPQVRLAFESAMASYETGSVDFLSLLASFSSVVENEMNYFESLAEFHAAVSRLESMTGEPLAH
jgi:outer membrane protein TolC